MEENIFNKIPNWLRYIISIPLGLIAVIICYLIGYWSNLYIASPDSIMMDLYTFIYQNCINTVVFFTTLCYILPKYQLQFVITISVLILMVGFVGLGMVIISNTVTVDYIIGFVLSVITFIVSCIYTFKKYYKTKITINSLNDIIKNPTKLQNVINGIEQIEQSELLQKQNPYTGEIIQNYDDIILYLKMYQLDYKGINPMSLIK